jgi:hypothetical protein
MTPGLAELWRTAPDAVLLAAVEDTTSLSNEGRKIVLAEAVNRGFMNALWSCPRCGEWNSQTEPSCASCVVYDQPRLEPRDVIPAAVFALAISYAVCVFLIWPMADGLSPAGGGLLMGAATGIVPLAVAVVLFHLTSEGLFLALGVVFALLATWLSITALFFGDGSPFELLAMALPSGILAVLLIPIALFFVPRLRRATSRAAPVRPGVHNRTGQSRRPPMAAPD